MLAPFVLRRLKSGVLKQLVAKTEKLEKVSLSKVSTPLTAVLPYYTSMHLTASPPRVTVSVTVVPFYMQFVSCPCCHAVVWCGVRWGGMWLNVMGRLLVWIAVVWRLQ